MSTRPATPKAEDGIKPANPARVKAPKPAEAAKAESAKTSEAARAEAAKTAEAAKAQAVKTADAAKVEAVKAAETSRTEGLIDKAKLLISESKFSDASSVIQQLSGQSLTAQQTKVVDGLKEQIQKALVAKAADNAAGAVGNLLNK